MAAVPDMQGEGDEPHGEGERAPRRYGGVLGELWGRSWALGFPYASTVFSVGVILEMQREGGGPLAKCWGPCPHLGSWVWGGVLWGILKGVAGVS